MILSLILLLFVTAGGIGVTLLFAGRKTLIWRISAGYIVGSCIFGAICFAGTFLVSFGWPLIVVSGLLAASPALLVRNKELHETFAREYFKAKGRIEGFTSGRVVNLLFYLFFLILFAAFFDRAMILEAGAIFTGASNNLGDLPFHLGAIYSFTDGANFPPINPSFAGAKFTYPFLADFLTATLVKLGASVQGAMLLENVSWAFALLVILETFAREITGSKTAGKIAVALLFFSGGLGFVWFLRDYWNGAQGLFEILWNLPMDYTIGDKFRWGNSLVVLFITQRSLLLGMPLALIVMQYLWRLLSDDQAADDNRVVLKASATVGILAGLLPLVHAHSLFVLFVVSAFFFPFSYRRFNAWIAFGIATAIPALTIVFWMMSGSASGAGSFFAWHFGFDSRGSNILYFWLKNTGIFIPVALFGVYLLSRMVVPKDGEQSDEDSEEGFSLLYLVYAAPFVFLFVVSNLAKFAPWEWDNIKILIYAFVGMSPFAAYAIVRVWRMGVIFKVAASGGLLILLASGALDVWRTASQQMKYGVFEKDAVALAEAIRDRTDEHSIILNAPTYNTAAVLTGRISAMRYVGHLSSHGIDYRGREEDLRRIYSGEATADLLIKKYGIDYILVTPRETLELDVNQDFFNRYELFAESGAYRVYRTGRK
ncbi:MAG: hypothetical protein R2684_11980 [Pyrinomonadaceae bacterium]